MPPDESGVPGTTHGVSYEQPLDSDLDQLPSASQLKLKLEDNFDSVSECFDEESACDGEGYRLLDLKKWSVILDGADPLGDNYL